MKTVSWPANWQVEHKSPYIVHALAESKRVCERQTAYQHLVISENPELGRYLILDGQLQSATRDAFIYHECLVHPAMIAHSSPGRVAILGGGDGATLKEILRYRSVDRVVMVELDPEVIEMCQRHMPEMAERSFADPRLELVIGDAWKWLQSAGEPFDVIISDLTEPDNESLAGFLLSSEFFAQVRNRLGTSGVLSMQASCGCFEHLARHAALRRRVEAHFKHISSLVVFVPSYNCHWAFLTASQTHNPKALSLEEVDARLAARLDKPLDYYDGEAHQRVFSLPLYLRRQLASPVD